MKTDSLTHPDHPCERWRLMNQSISSTNKPDSLTALILWHGQSESVNQPVNVVRGHFFFQARPNREGLDN